MIKKISVLILLLLACWSIGKPTTFVKTGNYAEGWVSFEIFALNDTGLVSTPDSVLVLVFRDSSSTNALTYSSYCDDANWADSSWIDSLTYRGTKHYYFRQQINTLVNTNPIVGGYHGTVWTYADGQGTPNKFSFQIIDADSSFPVLLRYPTSLVSDSVGKTRTALNLDNFTGTLANSQVDDDVNVNVYTMTAGAITATVIADDAIDYATFAATAPTAWWNEGKTGYALTSDYLTKADTGSTGASYLRTKYVEDKTGYSLASAQFIEFWNVAFGSAFTAGSMGDSLNNASYMQGSASGLTAQGIWEYNLSSAFDDASDSNQAGHQLRHSAHILAESLITTAQTDSMMKGIYRNAGDLANWYDNIWNHNISAYSGTGYAGTYLKSLYDSQDWNPWDNATRTLTNLNWSLITGDSFANYFLNTQIGWLRSFDEDTTLIDIDGRAVGRLSSQGEAYLWTHDTTGENSGWAQFFKERLDANMSSRGTSNLIASDNIGLNWADITNPSTVQSLIGTRIKYVDSLGEEIAGGGNCDTCKVLNWAGWYNTDASMNFINSRFEKVDTAGYLLAGAGAGATAQEVWEYGTRILTSGVGTGANQVILTIKQSSDSTPIASAQVQVLNQGQTATIGLLTTNPSGQATFALDNAIYKVRMFKPGWQFTIPESVVVSGNTADTFFASVFNPGSPPSANLCRVYNWVYRAVGGQADSGAIIQMRIKTVPLKYGNSIINGYARRDTADVNGYFSLDVYPNSILTPSTTKYEVIIFKTDGTIYKDTAVTVPATNCWQLQ
jgi:hypothetical protein